MHQSIPSVNIPPGKFFGVVKSSAPGQDFSAKARPWDKNTPTPEEYFERSSQRFLLIGIKILDFCRNQSLKKNWKAVQLTL